MATAYGSLEDREMYLEDVMPLKEIKPKKGRWLSMVIGVAVVVAISLVVANNSQFQNSGKKLSFKEKKTDTDSSDLVSTWSLYKYTTSIPVDSYVNVQSFVNQYITEAAYAYNLGCNETYKVVASLGTPTSDVGLSGFQEMHWVDSSTFQTSGKSISDWSAYVSSLGYDTINPFMLNKVQLYVPDLSAHYSSLVTDGITTILRKSHSSGATDFDTAHIGIPISDAASIYELVGPLSSLTDDQQDDFSMWSESECAGVHQLPYSLTVYKALYETIEFNGTALAWTEKTGKYIPMGVAITIPTHSLDYIRDTMYIVKNVTTFPTVEYSADGCDVMAMDMYIEIDGSEGPFAPYVRYVDASSAMTVSGDFTISDWETEIADTHDSLLDMKAAYSKWDRYLDTHLGMMAEVTDEGTVCTDSEATIASVLASSAQDPAYSMRDSLGVHFYTATQVRRWH